MIRIRPSKNADARTATGKVGKLKLRRSSEQHRRDVYYAMKWMIERLMEIGKRHDWTKLVFIDEFHADFAATQNGAPGNFKDRHWYKEIHLQERHHLTDYCPEDVNLFDCLERLADIVTTGMARSGSVYADDIDPAILVKAYANTLEMLKREVEVVEYD